MNRPRSVAVVSWVWIALGAMNVFGGLLHYLAYFGVIRDSRAMAFPPPDGVPFLIRCLDAMVRHMVLLSVCEFAFGVVAIWSGICFLRLRPWARASLEVLSWFLLLNLVGWALLGVYVWLFGGGVPVTVGDWIFSAGGAAMTLFLSGLVAAATLMMIKCLRSDEVRAAVKESVRLIEEAKKSLRRRT